jgi:hypothetical protein
VFIRCEKLLVLLVEVGIVKYLYLNPRLAQDLYTAAAHLGVRVEMSRHDAPYTGPQDHVRTRWRLAVVVARFERYIQLGASRCRARPFESRGLSVVTTGACVPALANHHVVTHHHRPHEGVRCRGIAPVFR